MIEESKSSVDLPVGRAPLQVLKLNFRPLSPMRRTNVNGPPSFGINPVISQTATGEDEFVHPFMIHDCKMQVTLGWDFRY